MAYEELNPKQQQLVRELDENILLLAPAGTGKTNTIAYRVANIIQERKANPREIIGLTFTNRACKELKERIVSIVGPEGNQVIIRTFHSFCFDVIKQESKRYDDLASDFIIFDEEDSLEVVRELIERKDTARALLNVIQYIREEKLSHPTKDYRQVISQLHTDQPEKLKQLCSVNYQFDKKLYDQVLKAGHLLIQRYQEVLAERHALDFVGLIQRTHELFQIPEVVQRWREAFSFIHVDEVQDTSDSEYTIVSKLFPGNIVMMCGDYFQTIYEWRGSKPHEVFRRFKNEYTPKTIIFDQNYRSTKTLLGAAQHYLSDAFGQTNVTEFHQEQLPMDSVETGEKIVLRECADEQEEADWIFDKIRQLPIEARSRTAILTRINKTAVALSERFENANQALPEEEKIGFLLVEEYKFFRRQEIKDVLAFIKLLMNKHDHTSLIRISERFVKGVGKKKMEHLTGKEAQLAGIRMADLVDPITHQYGDPYALLIKALKEASVIIFDVESTGVDTTRDEIIQIAAIKVNQNGKVVDSIEVFIKPSHPVGTSEQVHGFSDAFLQAEGMEPSDAFDVFQAFIEDGVLVGHNVGFDIGILKSQMMRTGGNRPSFLAYYDTLDMARRFYPKLKNHKLETLSEVFQATVPSDHNAMNDVLCTKDVLMSMVTEKILPGTLDRSQFYDSYLEFFVSLTDALESFRGSASEKRPVEIIKDIMNRSKIFHYYEKESKRVRNLEELLTIADELDDPSLSSEDALTEFLKISALSNSEMDRLIKKTARIPVITVHQAKGLEYDYVFMAGMQDGLFPLYFAIKSGNLNEEKRLFYVAMTRARKKLFISYSKQTDKGHQKKSRLMNHLPCKYMAAD